MTKAFHAMIAIDPDLSIALLQTCAFAEPRSPSLAGQVLSTVQSNNAHAWHIDSLIALHWHSQPDREPRWRLLTPLSIPC